jgi:hypothetical protein
MKILSNPLIIPSASSGISFKKKPEASSTQATKTQKIATDVFHSIKAGVLTGATIAGTLVMPMILAEDLQGRSIVMNDYLDELLALNLVIGGAMIRALYTYNSRTQPLKASNPPTPPLSAFNKNLESFKTGWSWQARALVLCLITGMNRIQISSITTIMKLSFLYGFTYSLRTLSLEEKNRSAPNPSPKIPETVVQKSTLPLDSMEQTSKDEVKAKKTKMEDSAILAGFLVFNFLPGIILDFTNGGPFYRTTNKVKNNLVDLTNSAIKTANSSIKTANETYSYIKNQIYEMNHTVIGDLDDEGFIKTNKQQLKEKRKNNPVGYLRDLAQDLKGLSPEEISEQYGCADLLASWDIADNELKKHRKIKRDLSKKVHPDKNKMTDAGTLTEIVNLALNLAENRTKEISLDGKEIKEKVCTSRIAPEILDQPVQKTLETPGLLASFFSKVTCSYNSETTSWETALINCKDLIEKLPQASKDPLLKLI